jgi:hypothetical protein
MHSHALTAKERPVYASYALNEKEAVLVDMRNHETEFVDMPGKDDMRPMFRVAKAREGIAVGVTAELVAMRLNVFCPNALGIRFESGGRRRIDKVFQKLQLRFVHLFIMQINAVRGKTSTGKIPWVRMAAHVAPTVIIA